MDSYDVIVIFLSVTLFIFLILSIVALVFTIQILKKVKMATETAQHAVENVEEITSHLKQASKATAVGTALSQLVGMFKKK